MTEQWEPIPGYEGTYEVSSQGRVLSLKRAVPHPHSRRMTLKARVLKTRSTDKGHRNVQLHHNGAVDVKYVHRLVLEAFVGPAPEGKPYALHRNGNPADNRLENLYWGSNADNMNDAVRHGTHVMSRKTHCKRGHGFTQDNTLINPKGARVCRTCADLRREKHKRKLAQAAN